MTKSYTLSLTRWHKVVERLSQTYTELTNKVRSAFNFTEVAAVLGESQIARLRDLGKNESMSLARAFQIQDVLIQNKQAIGDANANAKTGVNRELAEYDALMRRYKFLISILNQQNTDMIGLDELPLLQNQFSKDDRHDRSQTIVRVKILDADAELVLRSDAEALLVKSYALADRISDLNREKLTLDLPEDVAQAAGL